MIEQKVISEDSTIVQEYLNEGWLIKTVTPKGYLILEREKKEHVPDLPTEELIKPMSAFDELSDDEVLYWSTPYYDELKNLKEQKQQRIKEEDSLRSDHG